MSAGFFFSNHTGFLLAAPSARGRVLRAVRAPQVHTEQRRVELSPYYKNTLYIHYKIHNDEFLLNEHNIHTCTRNIDDVRRDQIRSSEPTRVTLVRPVVTAVTAVTSRISRRVVVVTCAVPRRPSRPRHFHTCDRTGNFRSNNHNINNNKRNNVYCVYTV